MHLINSISLYFFYLFIYLFTYLFIYLFVNLFTYLLTFYSHQINSFFPREESGSSNQRFKDGVEIKTDEEIIRIPVSTSKGQNGNKLKIYATYSKVPIMNNPKNGNLSPQIVEDPWEFRPERGGANAVAELPSTRGIYFLSS